MRGRPYSLDLRERIVQAVQHGLAQQDVASRFSVSLSTVERYARRARSGRGLEPGPRAGRAISALPPAEYDALRAQVEIYPDLTIAEHVAVWCMHHTAISATTMRRRIEHVGLTRKKDGVGR